ncbi:HelD family protein [Peterkaempfera bronchialis]|uniref:HelD family protein n=1 Tax=Peterkaempfera bronchialis TaxID=2126346 RepID=UPI003C30D63B
MDSSQGCFSRDAEQRHLTCLYTLLDAAREQTAAALREAQRQDGGRTHQARVEREVTAAELARRLARLSAVEHGLCFGRIDDRDGTTLHIGRIGLRDHDLEPLLVDWRAPAARPFYTATPGSPGPLLRRRHLYTRLRTLTGLDDEVFDPDAMADADRSTLVGEAALLTAVRRGRTGRMGDIVATIQQEQDQVIRAGLPGVLVVQGGPGTGKTVAALHRAAYLLYMHRDVLERRGVLVVGPNATFLRYIEQVLPALGETEVVLASVGELYPGVRAGAPEQPGAEVVKGDLRMAALLAAAVADRQRVPDGDLVVGLDGAELRLNRESCVRARDRARAQGRPHNAARPGFLRALLTELVREQAARLGRPLDAEEERFGPGELWGEPAVRAALDALWPPLTPQRLLGELYADPAALRRAAARAGLTDGEWQLLARPPGSPWTTADAPLLDEAAELLGDDGAQERARRRAAERERREEERYAQGVLQVTGLAEQGTVDAAALADRYRADGPAVSTAQRAARDREWVYGHVIVDEAQELSAMAWRAVMRRVPTRSMTVVGDLAQTGSAAGARSWGEMLDRYVGGRWREARLLVNYRTPASIMAVAADVLRAVAPDQQPPEPVRDGGDPPRAVRVPEDDPGAGLAALVREELAAIGEGRLGVVVSAGCREAVHAALPEAARGASPEALDSPAVVLSTAEAKGLEFDAVVVVDPAGILAGSPKGGQDLYVALTRATRRLTVVHPGPLPELLGRLVR